MPPPDGGKDPVIHGLRVDADPVYPVFPENRQLLRCDGVRPAGLHGALHGAGKVEPFIQPAQQPVHLLRRQGSGGAAAHIEGTDTQTQLLHHGRRAVRLRQQGLQVGLHQMKGFFHAVADKAAIGAPGRTEGDAHIQGYLVFLQLPLGLQASLGAGEAQLPAGFGNKVGVPQDGVRLGLALPLLQQSRRQLGGADAGEGAPGGGNAGKRPGRLKKAELYGPLLQTLLRIFIRRRRNVRLCRTPGGLSAHGQLRDGGCSPAIHRQLHPGRIGVLPLIDGPLLREESQQALLHGIAVVVSLKKQLHRPVACRTQGLVRRSCSRVDSAPWPGQTL